MAYFAIYFGGYMKRSSIFTKIMLAMVLLALVFALVACNNTGDDDDGTDPVTPPEEEATLAEQLVDIIKAAGPLFETINGIEAGSTVSADVKATVEYKMGESSGNYSVALAGNINSTSPELTANFKNGSTEWLGLTYVGNKVYLNQPLTAVNTSSDHDKISADVAALEPAVNDIMYIVMDALAGLNIDIDFDKLAEELGGLIGTIDSSGAISEMIQITSSANGHTITLTPETINMVMSLLPAILPESIVPIINTIIPTGTTMPTITLEVRHNETDGINGLKLAYEFADGDKGSLDLDLSLSTSSKVTVSAPTGYANKPLVANLSASLPQKGADVALGLMLNPDFSAKGKNLAYATAAINGEHQVNGFFDGQAVYFDTGALYDALNSGNNQSLVTKPANTQYKATLQKGEVGALTATTLIDMINEGAKSVKDNYIANKGKDDNTSSGDDTSTAPSKGILVTIYEWLGGTATIKDGAYVDPTEAEMLKALDNNIGEYVRFNVDEDEYYKVLKNILTLFNDNEEWLIGVDLIKDDFAGNINGIEDFITFKNWINTVEANADGIYGIFDWDTATWSGGATLTKAGANNDFLDAVNVFVCLGLDADNEPIDITSDNISEFMNYYIAALGYYVDGFYTAEQMQAIDAADKALLIAKNVYLASNKTEADAQALAEAEAAHKTALEAYYTAANANRIIEMLIGYTGTTDNYLKDLIDGGVYVGIGCTENAGLNGYIALASDNTAEAVTYAMIAGSIGFVDTEHSIDELVSAVAIDKEAAQELYAPEVTTDEAYKVIDTWEDGTLKVDADGNYIYKMDGDNYVYSNRYVNGEKLLGELYSAFLAYMDYEKAA